MVVVYAFLGGARVVLEGVLSKWGTPIRGIRLGGSWKRRVFRLKSDGSLQWFMSPVDMAKEGITDDMDEEGASVAPPSTSFPPPDVPLSETTILGQASPGGSGIAGDIGSDSEDEDFVASAELKDRGGRRSEDFGSPKSFMTSRTLETSWSPDGSASTTLSPISAGDLPTLLPAAMSHSILRPRGGMCVTDNRAFVTDSFSDKAPGLRVKLEAEKDFCFAVYGATRSVILRAPR